MLKKFPHYAGIMLALCFMLCSPYYAENYAGIIDSSLDVGLAGIYTVIDVCKSHGHAKHANTRHAPRKF